MGKTRLSAGLAAAIVILPALANAKGIERRLYPDRVEASSFLWNDWNRFQENYHPNYIADDDPKTAWTEGAESAGAGEWLRVHVTPLAGTTQLRLRVRNGYHKSKRLFTRNARAKQVTVRLLPSGKQHKVTLADDMKWQDITLSQPAGELTGFELRFDSVYDGTHYTDLCVSDVQVFATASTPDNPSFEKSKRKKLLDWKKQRVQAARMFKRSVGKSLPIASQYRAEQVGKSVKSPRCNGDDDHFCEARAALAAAHGQWKDRTAALDRATAILDKDLPNWKAAHISPVDKRPTPAVDGTRSPSPSNRHWIDENAFDLPLAPGLGFLQSKHLKRVFDATSKVKRSQALMAEAKGCRKMGKTGVYMWTPDEQLGGQAHLQSLFVVACSTYEERDGEYAVANWQLLVYDDAGNLSLMVGPQFVTRFEWKATDKGAVLDRAERIAVHQPRTVFAAASAPAKKTP